MSTWVAEANRLLKDGDTEGAAAARRTMLELAAIFGYDFGATGSGDGLVAPLVAELLNLRTQARDRKDFATADAIRTRLSEVGVVVEDSPDGPRWHLAPIG